MWDVADHCRRRLHIMAAAPVCHAAGCRCRPRHPAIVASIASIGITTVEHPAAATTTRCASDVFFLSGTGRGERRESTPPAVAGQLFMPGLQPSLFFGFLKESAVIPASC